MKKCRFALIITLLFSLLLGQSLSVWGAEKEWYDLHEVDNGSEQMLISQDDFNITPYTRYILGTSVLLRRPSSSVLWMRSEVYCTETMSKITTVFTVQKKIGNSWVDVGQGTVSVSNDNSMYKSMEATGVSSGTYRCIANTQVISKTGYAETSSVISNTV